MSGTRTDTMTKTDAVMRALRHAGTFGDGDRVTDLTQLLGGWSRHSFFADAELASGEKHRYVVRAKPQGALLDTDLTAEYHIYRALNDSDIAAPRAFCLEESEDTPFGGPFFVMDFIEGRAANMFQRSDRAWLEEDWNGSRQIAEDMVQNLARIHALPTDHFGDVPELDFLDVVQRWREVYEEKHLIRDPVVEEAYNWLAENVPQDTWPGLVHGDYRIGNTLVDDGRVRAILDWELAYRGDVRFDLGYLLLEREAGKHLRPRSELLGTFADENWFLGRYAELSGRTVDREALRPFEMLGIIMLLATQFTAVWMYTHGHTTDMRMAWSRFSFAGLRQDMAKLMQW
jgi:aminoglycoside phosphotransferase (APT) family kinase protein